MSDDMETSATVTSRQLTPTDRQLLAREDALDKFSGRYNFDRRADWCTGWDAAMEWVKQQQHNPCGEEEQGYPHFSDGGMPLG